MPKKRYDVLVDPDADAKMSSHIRFLSQVSVPAADRLLFELSEAINSLKSSPETYPFYMPLKPIDAELRYKMCTDRYRIVFEIIGNEVFIYDIQDCRQDINNNLI
jgi:hypothetical protein